MSTTPWDLAEWLRSLDDGFNTDGELCREAANQLEALSRIHAKLDGREWGADTAASIAEDLRGIGLEVRDLDDCTCDARSWHGPEHDTLCPLAGIAR
jgi:hypothetical protein